MAGEFRLTVRIWDTDPSAAGAAAFAGWPQRFVHTKKQKKAFRSEDDVTHRPIMAPIRGGEQLIYLCPVLSCDECSIIEEKKKRWQDP